MLDFPKYLDAAGASLRSTSDVSLQSRVDAANLLLPADMQIPAIGDERILPGGTDPIGPPYPLIEFTVPDFTMTGLDLGQYSGDVATSVAFRVWLMDAVYDRLWRTLYRFSDCVCEALLQPDAFGTSVVVDNVRGSFGLNPETGERQEILASAVLVFTLQDIAARP